MTVAAHCTCVSTGQVLRQRVIPCHSDEDDDDDNHPSGVRWCNENETIGNMGVEDVEIEHVAGPVVEFGSTSNHCAYKLATHQPSFQV